MMRNFTDIPLAQQKPSVSPAQEDIMGKILASPLPFILEALVSGGGSPFAMIAWQIISQLTWFAMG